MPRSCPATAHIYRWTLWENDPSAVSSPKKQQQQQQQQQQKTPQATGQRELEIYHYDIQL